MRTVEAAGCRIGDRMTLGSARERIKQQIAASAVWLELDRDCGAGNGRSDRVHRDNSAIELIIDADDAERIAALVALAAARAGMAHRVSDIASDQNAERLRQLSDEVSRIAASLARLSAGPTPAAHTIDRPATGEAPEVSAEKVRAVIRARRLRSRYLPEYLFTDPAWDMLLDLLHAEVAQLRVPVSSLCIAAAVPATTALRWLKSMVHEGVFVRRAEPHDGRRVFVELAPATEPGAPPLLRRSGEPGGRLTRATRSIRSSLRCQNNLMHLSR